MPPPPPPPALPPPPLGFRLMRGIFLFASPDVIFPARVKRGGVTTRLSVGTSTSCTPTCTCATQDSAQTHLAQQGGEVGAEQGGEALGEESLRSTAPHVAVEAVGGLQLDCMQTGRMHADRRPGRHGV